MTNVSNYRILLLILGFIFVFTACHENNVSPDDNIPKLRPISATEQEVISASNNFSFDILNRLNDEADNKNIFISPFSINAALSMLLNGAEGATKSEILNTLQLEGLSDDQINQAYKDLVEYLYGLDKKVELSVANSNWLRNNLTINDNFKSVLSEYYDAELRTLDFSRPESVDIINGWIEDKTKGKIVDMLDQVPSDVVMYLINAIYFKATWMYQFDKTLTEDRNFYTESDGAVAVKMMTSKGVLVNYAYEDDYLYFEIPYGNGQYTMSVVLPNEEHTVDDLLDQLDASKVASLSERADTSKVELRMPKFKLEYKKLLNEILMEMGMVKAFGDEAELTGFVEQPIDLLVSRVIHQSFLEVNEEGTEAAAATIVELVETSMPVGPNKPKLIELNKPFAFFITEKHSGTILFAGKLDNPLL